MATTPWDDSPPTIAERYEGASGTSNLTVFGGMIPKDSSTPDGDVVCAAGMAQAEKYGAIRLGMALLRLHSEWTSAPKPNRVKPHALERMAEIIKADDAKARESAATRGKPYEEPGSPVTRANRLAQDWYSAELRQLAHRLKSKGAVSEELQAWAALKGIASQYVSEGLLYWLHSTCTKCDGHGLRYLEHQAVRQCHDCDGTGSIRRSEGAGRVVAHIGYALGVARSSTSKRLRG